MDATDGRAYVALGKVLSQQRRSEEARAVYEEGSTATGGRNEYIWQAWATLEARCGNASQARKVRKTANLKTPVSITPGRPGPCWRRAAATPPRRARCGQFPSRSGVRGGQHVILQDEGTPLTA